MKHSQVKLILLVFGIALSVSFMFLITQLDTINQESEKPAKEEIPTNECSNNITLNPFDKISMKLNVNAQRKNSKYRYNPHMGANN